MNPFVAGAVVVSLSLAHRAQAQGGVQLQLRPHAGDTLRLRMDQTIEVSRFTKPTGEESTVDAASSWAC